MDIEKIYSHLPISLQHITCSLWGLKLSWQRYDSQYRDILYSYESRSYAPCEYIKIYRNQKLIQFIKHAASSVPYYQELFSRLKIKPEDIKNFKDLSYLPILSKMDVQANPQAFTSLTISPKEMVICHTSGTTGGGLRFAETKRAIKEQWAVWWRYRHWHNIDEKTWCGYFGGRSIVPLSQKTPPFWRYNYPGRQIIFSGYHMSPQYLNYYIEQLRFSQPPWLHGYPSLLAVLAGFVLDKHIDLGYQIKWITIGAESLLPHQTDLLEKAFKVRPKQHYGMAEAAANISECEFGSLHVDEDFAAVEFIPGSNGSSYKIIGTNFTNPATPLIRYDVQDMVALSNRTCSCGRPGRVVETIDGRQEDYVILKNGAKIGRMDHVFKDMVNIREAQIYQRVPGDITLRVVRGAWYDADDEIALIKETIKRVGEDTNITVTYVDSLPRSKTGKLRFVVSEIENGQTIHLSDS